MAKLHDYYKDEVVNKLMTEFNYNSVMQVPRVEKITLNMVLVKRSLTRNCWITQQPIWQQSPVKNRSSPKPANMLQASKSARAIRSAVK